MIKLIMRFLGTLLIANLLTIPLVGQSFLDSLQASFEFHRGALADNSPNALDAVGYDISSDVGLEGSINGAYVFNGVSSYMNCGTDDRNVTDQLTISAWFKTTSTDRQIIVSKYNVNLDRGYVLGIIEGGEASLDGRDGSSTFHRLTTDGINVADGQWHHLVGTIDQNQWKLYLDDQLVNEITTNTISPQFIVPEPLTIGRLSTRTNDGFFYFFKGTIDNVKLFNTALDIEEIEALSNLISGANSIPDEVGSVTLYPNPATDLLKIALDFNKNTKVNLEIFDLQGRTLWQQDWYGQSEILEMPMNTYSAGVYLLRLFLPQHNAYQSMEVIKN